MTLPITRIVAGRTADADGQVSNAAVSFSAGKITNVETAGPDLLSGDIDCRHLTLVPGFIDLHVHGGAGDYVMDGDREGLRRIARHLARHGVTGFLSTTITGPWSAQARALDKAADQMLSPDNGSDGAAVLGVHLEGPYINPVKKGAQPGEYILAPDISDLVFNAGEHLSIVKVVTLAPEMPGALELIQFLSNRGIVASIGHTNATYDEVSAAIDAGARHVTHCFNAMRPMESREPGVVGAAFSRDELSAELIWDNIHVHPASCVALVNAKRAKGVILISDGIPGTGMEDGYQFHLGEHAVVVKNGSARLQDGTLAGSLLTLDRAFANAGHFTLAERCAMTSRNAAISLGHGGRKGLISAGFDADFVLLDNAGTVQRTVVAGKTVYQA